jgi:hypothetical protein
MRKEAKESVANVKDLDVVIKFLKRRMKKHPEENHRNYINKYADEQMRALKQSVREIEDFLSFNDDVL